MLIADYYLLRRQHVVVDDLFTMSSAGRYWYQNGYNPDAVLATGIAGAVSIASVIVPKLADSASGSATTAGSSGAPSDSRRTT